MLIFEVKYDENNDNLLLFVTKDFNCLLTIIIKLMAFKKSNKSSIISSILGNESTTYIDSPLQHMESLDLLENQVENASLSSSLLSSSYKSISSKDFLSSTYNRINTCIDKKKNWLEEERRKQFMDEVSKLQDRPKINPYSKKIITHKSPLHQRLEILLRQKKDNIKVLQIESLMKKRHDEEKECTFQPRSANTTPRRTPKQFIEQSEIWHRKKLQTLKKEQDENEKSKDIEVKSKPQICKKSAKLTVKVNNK